MKNHFCKNLLPLGLCVWIAVTPSVAFPQTLPARIDILVMEGEGVTDNIRQRVTRDPVVKIQDDDHRPIDGAVVVFALPVSGTSGEFPDGSKTLTVVTGKDGLATARGIKTNEVPGNLQIYVMASFQGLRARGLVNQLVEVPPGTTFATPEIHASKSGGKWKWLLLGAVVVGGAGAGIYFARRTNNNSTPNVPVTISAGPVVFGNP